MARLWGLTALLWSGAALADLPPRPPPEPDTPERWIWAVAIGAAVLALEIGLVWWRWGRRRLPGTP
ncbi:MAG: hypothetical protein IV100_24575 [Myxococcales bacterium]|nr:hypothetical protein [Myxococcales bacterium]